jgi:hypothetical protein
MNVAFNGKGNIAVVVGLGVNIAVIKLEMNTD